jgi:hypothetical protein
MNEVMTIAKKYNCTVIRQEMQLFCHIVIGIAVNRQEEVLYRLKDMQGVELSRE